MKTHRRKALILIPVLLAWAVSLFWTYRHFRCPPEGVEEVTGVEGEEAAAEKNAYADIYLTPPHSLVTHCWEFEDFQFYIKHLKNEDFLGYEGFASVHLNERDLSFKLFDYYFTFTREELEPRRLFDDVYAVPYNSGGNCSRCIGLEVFRINGDTAIYLGPVSGWKDLDGDGSKEFYANAEAEYDPGARQAFDELKISYAVDSLIYPELDGW